MEPLSVQPSDRRASPSLVVAWVLLGALMLVGIGRPAIVRTQEARVLEVAREMLGSGPRGWIIPHVNGRIRLQKPPLTYWITALAYKLGGVSEGVGRVPFAILGWLTLALAYRIGHRLFGLLAGLLGAAALAGCYIFARHARLAETDGPAMLFVTASIWWTWCGATTHDARERRRCLHGAAATLALALMSKQGTVAYPLVFMVAWSAVERQWRWLRAWITSGAILTFLLIGLPWWIVTGRSVGWDVFVYELRNLAEGRNHRASFVNYVPMLVKALVPWIGLTVVAVIAAVGRWRTDAHVRGLLVWTGSILVPLCFVGNKQFHYLMPAAVPLTVLTGWAAAAVLRGTWPQPQAAAFRAVLLVTIGLMLAAGVGVALVGHRVHGSVKAVDVAFVLVISIVSLWGLAVFFKRPAAAGLLLLVVTPIVSQLLVTLWAPTLGGRDHQSMAMDLRRRFGDGPYAFYGTNESIALSFGLRAVVPQLATEAQLREALAREPRLVVIAQTKNDVTPPPIPEGLEKVAEAELDEQSVRVYTTRR